MLVSEEAPRIVVKTNQLSSLKHWGLVIPKTHIPDKKKSSGFWMPTPQGVAFACGTLRVPDRKWIYDDVVVKESVEETDIHKALKTDFNYSAMMSASLDDDLPFTKNPKPEKRK